MWFLPVRFIQFPFIIYSILFFSAQIAAAHTPPDMRISGDRVLIVVVDGLRPDYVTDQLMPTLAAIKGNGFDGRNHHSVYPTSTRINSASIATGSYPQRHGLLNNTLYLPGLDKKRKFDTGKATDLQIIEKQTAGRLLSTETLGEIMSRHGKKLFLSASGSSGSAYLLSSHTDNCMLVHRQLTVPDSLMGIVEERIGPPEEDEDYPHIKRIKWSVDALLEVGLDKAQADVLVLWITEPDGSAHRGGIGSPLCIEALKAVDSEIARLLTGLNERQLMEKTNIFFISDHGFSTRTGEQSLTSLLIENGLKSAKSSTDVVIANDAIYVNENKSERLPAIVKLLQKTSWIGPVFTRGKDPQSMQGSLDGTLSFAAVMWDHPRAADILTSGNWTNNVNKYGFPGTVMLPGTAGHNSTSPFDIHASFFAMGPDIKAHQNSTVPSGNVDLAPTALYLLGVKVPDEMDGRVIREALKSGPPLSAVAVRSEKYRAETIVDGIDYQTTVYQSFVDGTTYLDSTVTTRNP